MKTKTIELYTYDELEPKAKERALSHWREGNDYFFLQDCLNERLHELLETNNIKDTNDTSKPGTTPTQVLYSLGYSQGDGVCFTGEFIWKKYTIYIHHIGRYYHSNSTAIELQETSNLGFHMDEDDKCVKDFEKIYQRICKELEKNGYGFIEWEDSEESFIDACSANDWTFRANGDMENI